MLYNCKKMEIFENRGIFISLDGVENPSWQAIPLHSKNPMNQGYHEETAGRDAMDFGKQFKKIRTDLQLTQEQVSLQLNVSRQAVSNWENNKNLPDIEMIIDISRTFGISLDQLILGEDKTSNITEKLIEDGSETRRAKLNLIALCVGSMLLIMGVGCIFIKAYSVEYIDADGFLHENFFLLPIGFLFIFCSFITFFVTGIKNIISKIRRRRKKKKSSRP